MPEYKISAGWATLFITLIVLSVSLVGNWAVFGWRINKMDERLDVTEDMVIGHESLLHRNSEKLDWICSSLERIEQNQDSFVTEDVCEARCGV